MKKLALLLVLAMMLVSLAACSKSEETETQTKAPETTTETEAPADSETESETETETEAETETEEELPEGKMRSFLTGEIVDTEQAMQRPFAIMTNNIIDALPQYGISQASIVYECIVEGDITRLMTVYEDVSNLTKMGSIRSARHDYLDLAMDEEAIYCHFGWSYAAENRIKNEGIKTLNGQASYTNLVYYRTTDRYAPHNVFTNGDMLLAGLEPAGIGTRELEEGHKGRLKFNTEDTEPEGGFKATDVSIPFSSRSRVVYDEESKLYLKYEYGKEHIDGETGEQLKFKNVIIQLADYTAYIRPDTGTPDPVLQEIQLYGEGKGYYISDGKAVEITWKKKDANDKTRYYLSDGSQLKMNVGKTYIAVAPPSYNITFE